MGPAQPPFPRPGRGRGRPRTTAPRTRPASRRALVRVFRQRRRALRQLGVAVPRALAQGPAGTLHQRLDTLERWIALDLDLAGGKRLPAWELEEDPFEEDEDPASPLT